MQIEVLDTKAGCPRLSPHPCTIFYIKPLRKDKLALELRIINISHPRAKPQGHCPGTSEADRQFPE